MSDQPIGVQKVNHRICICRQAGCKDDNFKGATHFLQKDINARALTDVNVLRDALTKIDRKQQITKRRWLHSKLLKMKFTWNVL